MSICKKSDTGAWIEMCPSLTKVTNEQIGDIETQVRVRISDQKRKLVIAAGRFKKNKVQLNYCPFCGADVFTEFGDEVEE